MGLGSFLRKLFGSGDDDAFATGWSESKAKPGTLDLDELARRLEVSPAELTGFQPTYHEYQIPKRSGGTRRICAPDPQLKALQKKILKRLLRRLKTHPAAHGFEKGRSILTNAAVHTNRAAVLHMDIVDFFGQTRAERVAKLFRRLGWNKEATKVLVNLTTHKGSLPQGAPTSPRLANLVNRGMDARLSGVGRRLGARYTRSADDLTFSLPDTRNAPLGIFSRMASLVVEDEGYTIHKRKKRHVRRTHQRQIVTGLVVNQRPRLPRETRRWLRAVEHHLRTGKDASLTPVQLAGWKSLQSMIDNHTPSP